MSRTYSSEINVVYPVDFGISSFDPIICAINYLNPSTIPDLISFVVQLPELN